MVTSNVLSGQVYANQPIKAGDTIVLHSGGIANSNVVSSATMSATGGEGKVWDKHAAAPLCVEEKFIRPLLDSTQDQAMSAGLVLSKCKPTLTHSNDLCLITNNGQIIHKIREENGKATFIIPAGAGDSVRISSRSSRPYDIIGPFVDDRRSLGVLVGDITCIYSKIGFYSMNSHLTEVELDGWNAPEGSSCRWTTGDALLKLDANHSDKAAILSIQILAGGPYLLEDQYEELEALSA